MLGNDSSPLLLRANEASDRLDKAAASGDPFAILKAKDDATKVVNELTERVNTDHALAMFKAAQTQPRALFDERAPGGYTQSSNISSSPRGRPTVQPSGVSIMSPGTFPQNSNASPIYSAEERRAMSLSGEAMPDGSHPIRTRDDLAASLGSWAASGKPVGALKDHIRNRARAIVAEDALPPEFRGSDKFARGDLRKDLAPPSPKIYDENERAIMARTGHALPDGSFAIKHRGDVEQAVANWQNFPKPGARAHIKRRATELGCPDCLPEDWQ
jgi:hypothetical protein